MSNSSNDDKDRLRRIENALQYLVRASMTSGSVIERLDRGERVLQIDEDVERVMQTGDTLR